MDFTPTPIANFDQALRDFVIRNEGKETLVNGAKVYLPYNQVVIDDVVGVPTLGYGYALVVKNSAQAWVARDITEINRDIAGTSIQITEADHTALRELAENLNTGATISQLQTLLSNKRDGGSLAFTLTDAGATTLLDNGLAVAKATVRNLFVSRLGSVDGENLFNQLQGSKEFVAVTDMAYQAPGLVGSEITRRLFESPRFDVVDEVFFRSNGNQLKGYQERNFRRIAMFQPVTNGVELNAFLTYMEGNIPAMTDYAEGLGYSSQQIIARFQENLFSQASAIAAQQSPADFEAADIRLAGLQREFVRNLGITVTTGADGILGTADDTGVVIDPATTIAPGDTGAADDATDRQSGDAGFFGGVGEDVLYGGNGDDPLGITLEPSPASAPDWRIDPGTGQVSVDLGFDRYGGFSSDENFFDGLIGGGATTGWINGGTDLLATTLFNFSVYQPTQTVACFGAGTPVLMADGSERPIESIAVGDKVMAFDGAGELRPAPVIRTYIHPDRPVFDLDGLKVTAEHPFLLENGSFAEIGRLRPGAKLVRAGGEKVSFAGLSALPGLHVIHNLEVAGPHTYVAGGFRVHNKTSAGAPVVLDLDGDGIELVQMAQSAVFFDIDADGYLENTGWAGADDGILAIDLAANGGIGADGVITRADEFVFTRHAPGTTSDLAALRQAFDSNQDGILDDRDARWADFRVWQDLDQDGQSDAGELKTLAELGITAIGLSSVPYMPAAGATPGPKDSTINALASYTKADGSIGMLSAAAARRRIGATAALW